MIKHCPRCGNAVELKALGSVSAEDKPMSLTVSGKEQLRSAKDLQGHTSQAIASLNDAAGFPHSG